MTSGIGDKLNEIQPKIQMPVSQETIYGARLWGQSKGWKEKTEKTKGRKTKAERRGKGEKRDRPRHKL